MAGSDPEHRYSGYSLSHSTSRHPNAFCFPAKIRLQLVHLGVVFIEPMYIYIYIYSLSLILAGGSPFVHVSAV